MIVGDTVYLYLDGNSATSVCEKFDKELGINLKEKILSLYERANSNPRDGAADFYGYIERRYPGSSYAQFHITHILETR